jgi:hypothetical protein
LRQSVISEEYRFSRREDLPHRARLAGAFGFLDLLEDPQLPEDLAADIIAWTDRWNANPKPYRWVKTADQIFKSVASCLLPTH